MALALSPTPSSLPVHLPPLRLRGRSWTRAVVGALLVGFLLLVGRAVLAPPSAASPTTTPPSSARAVVASAGATVHVVAPGETLWQVARQLQPSGDVRPLVERLSRAHGRGPLVPGERLVLPASSGGGARQP